MTTQILKAKKGIVSDEMYQTSRVEGVDVEYIRQKVAQGRVILLKNKLRNKFVPLAVGEGLKVKINANISSSGKKNAIVTEPDKARVIEQAGADALLDLSTGGYIDEVRQNVIQSTHLPFGSVPIYQARQELLNSGKNISKMTKEMLLSDIEKQLEDGVDFVTLHCALTKNVLKQLDTSERLMGIVSKGGAILASWMKSTKKENPLYQYFDDVLQIVKKYDAVISIGNALRAGCVHDAFDRAQMAEFVVMGELVKRAREAGVQTIVEGGGHLSLDKIPFFIKTIKELTDYAPLSVIGPLVCDCAPGHDDITSAIGSACAAYNGADILCCVSAGQYLPTSSYSQVREGIIAAKISAHSADLARKNSHAIKKNYEISKARIESDFFKQKDNAIDKNAFDGIGKTKKFKNL